MVLMKLRNRWTVPNLEVACLWKRPPLRASATSSSGAPSSRSALRTLVPRPRSRVCRRSTVLQALRKAGAVLGRRAGSVAGSVSVCLSLRPRSGGLRSSAAFSVSWSSSVVGASDGRQPGCGLARHPGGDRSPSKEIEQGRAAAPLAPPWARPRDIDQGRQWPARPRGGTRRRDRVVPRRSTRPPPRARAARGFKMAFFIDERSGAWR
jgi:hypothetical protein